MRYRSSMISAARCARPGVGTLDVHDRDDRAGLVFVHHGLDEVDDAGEWDLAFQERHDGDLVRGVHDRREREPQTADAVCEVDRGEGFAVDRFEAEAAAR